MTRLHVVVDYTPFVRVGVSDDLVIRAVRTAVSVARDHGKDIPSSLVVSVSAVGEARMRTLNRTLRKKDRVTDILSIEAPRDGDVLPSPQLLGELIFCWAYIKKSATIHGVTPQKEIVFVLAHGVFHLAGFRHSKEMFALQDYVVDHLHV